MKQNKLYKRFSVEISGRLVAVFETFQEAYNYVNYSRWSGLACIWDNERHEEAGSYILL